MGRLPLLSGFSFSLHLLDRCHFCSRILDVYQKKEWNQAIRVYQKAIELDPEMVAAYINLGVDYQKQNQLEFSMKVFLEAMRLQPKLAEARNNLGDPYPQERVLLSLHYDFPLNGTSPEST